MDDQALWSIECEWGFPRALRYKLYGSSNHPCDLLSLLQIQAKQSSPLLSKEAIGHAAGRMDHTASHLCNAFQHLSYSTEWLVGISFAFCCGPDVKVCISHLIQVLPVCFLFRPVLIHKLEVRDSRWEAMRETCCSTLLDKSYSVFVDVEPLVDCSSRGAGHAQRRERRTKWKRMCCLALTTNL